MSPDLDVMAQHMSVIIDRSAAGRVTVATRNKTYSVDFYKPEISADDLRSAVEALKDKALRHS